MNCTDCQNQFSEFIDDEISLEMARNLKSHLATCPDCAAEWRLFQHTVDTLHAFPIQKVPADFIIGINDKLAPQPFAKLKGWLAVMTQNKLTASGALATLVVGVIAATVLQLSPVDQGQGLAQRDGSKAGIMQAMTVDKDHNNYYPGIPYLAQNNPTNSPLPKNPGRVQFTPVKQSSPKVGHNSILDSRGPPALAHSALSRLEPASADLVVTVHSSSTSQQHALIRQLTANRHWKTQINGNTLFVTLPSSQLSTFQHIFAPADPHMNPRELSRLSKSAPASQLTIAVAFH